MAVPALTRSVAVGGIILSSLLGCSEHTTTPLPSAPPSPERPSFAAIPIYDSTGTPTVTSFSDNTEVTTTGGIVGYGGSDASSTRSYVENFNWSEPNAEWNIALSFSTGDLPFGTSYPSSIDVAQANMMFGVSAAQILERSGSAVPVPSTVAVNAPGATTTPFTIPLSTSSSVTRSTSSPDVALAVSSRDAGRDSLRRARHAAAVERLVVTPEGRARLLAKLRAKFQEAPGADGTRIFTHHSGANEVRVTFDSTLGGIRETETRSGGRLVSRSVNQYTTVQGATVLSGVTTTVFDANGTPLGTLTERHTNVVMH